MRARALVRHQPLQRKSPGVRVGVIDNPGAGSGRPGPEDTRLYRAVWSALLTQKNKAALDFTQKLLKTQTRDLLRQGAKMKDLLLQVTSGTALTQGNVRHRDLHSTLYSPRRSSGEKRMHALLSL